MRMLQHSLLNCHRSFFCEFCKTSFLRLHKKVILSRDSNVMHSFEKKSFLFYLPPGSSILITRMAIKLILVIRRSFLERRITKMGN